MSNMLDSKIWAVVGATDNTEKFGYKIYNKLKNNGYEVYGVNPNCTQKNGDKCYESLSDLPKKPDIIDMVVSPKRGKSIVIEAAELGIKNIWFQPGTTDDEIIQLVKQNGMNITLGCVLVEL